MKNANTILKLVVLSMLIALGVVISPILRVEGMCPMAHLINIVCSVLLGPWYSLLCATLIGIIRMVTMGIPPIALTGAIFGAFLSGVFYSTHSLPPVWREISRLNPFFYMIDGFRFGFFGASDINPFASLAIVTGFFVLLALIAMRLLATGYKLRH